MKTFIHISQVAGINLTAITITLSETNEVLKTISLIAAIAYTVYKFVKEFKKK
jgi:hypothetical protein